MARHRFPKDKSGLGVIKFFQTKWYDAGSDSTGWDSWEEGWYWFSEEFPDIEHGPFQTEKLAVLDAKTRKTI